MNQGSRNGGLKKVGEVPVPCMHPEHEPPKHIVLSPGQYEHTCPACGKVSRFTVQRVMC